MSDNSAVPGDTSTRVGFASAAGPKQLMEQLVQMLDHDDSGVDTRIEDLQSKLATLESKLQDGGGGGVSEEELADKLKKLVSSVLIQSGFLEKFVSSTVDRKLEESGGGGGGGGGDVKQQASELAKQFLSENLSTVFEKEIRAIVQKEVSDLLGREDMKVLLDEKFRAVTLYMKTDVVPSAVRQALKGLT